MVFRDIGYEKVAERLREYESRVASNLLEAEMRAGFARRGLAFDLRALTAIEWVFPSRPLTQEMEMVLSAGYLRGADLWHVATALFVAGEANTLIFLTLDSRQQAVAESLGFQV